MEEWKKIKGFEDLYEISDLGRVKSLRREYNHQGSVRTQSERFLKPYISVGYYKVDLYRNWNRKKKFIHSLVADAFIPNPNNKKCVNHKNGIRTDNRIENLEHVSYKENQVHSCITLGNATPQEIGNRWAKKVAEFSKDGNLIKVWDSLSSTGRDRCANIHKVIKKKRGIAYGSKWDWA